MNAKKISILIVTVFIFLYSLSTTLFHDHFNDGWIAFEKKDFKTAFKLWLPLAEKQNRRAQFHLGVLYEKGQGIPQDYNEASKWYLLAAEQGYTTAKAKIYSLAKFKVHYALEILTNDANNGVANAQFALAKMYEKGQGIPQDYDEAAKWYLHAVEQGLSSAKPKIYNLAKFKVPIAWETLTNDANNGIANAQLALGHIYRDGQGVARDYNEAFKWYQLAVGQGHALAKSSIYSLAKFKVSAASEILINDANNGIANAQLILGELYQNGQGVAPDYNEALKWYQLAEKLGHSSAKSNIYSLAKFKVPPALELLTNDANNGVINAQYALGSIYHYGQGVAPDYNEALKWYQLAEKLGHSSVKSSIYRLAEFKVSAASEILINDANNGIANAQLILGELYQNGQGIPQDYNEAFKWYQLAEKLGHSSAKSKIYSLAQFKVPPALEILTTDANNGVANAQFALGNIYHNGKGIPLNFNEAFKWYQLAAGQGHVPAKSNIYSLAQFKVSSASEILTNDANNGIAKAQLILGEVYQNGQGIPQDYNEAFKWYQLAADQGHASANTHIYSLAQFKVSSASEILTNDANNGASKAQTVLGKMYEKGQGVTQDYNEAFKWYQFAADQGHAPAKTHIYSLAKFKVPPALEILTNDANNGASKAQTVLGKMYEKGQGVTQDYKKAISWYQLATEKRYHPAQVLLAKIYEEGQVVPQDFKKAFNLYRMATEHENRDAQFKIGEMYYKGQGVSQNHKKALLWYQLASSNNNSLAKNALGKIYKEGKIVP
jgi:uncharacterized protein